MDHLLTLNPAWSDEEKLKFIEEVTADADAVQDRLLADILRRNAETEYLQRHKLDGATDRAAFKAKVPVIKYEDILPDIERIANGDRSQLLTAEPVTGFLCSSGTAGGRRKLIPTTRDDSTRRVSSFSLIIPVLNHHVQGLSAGKRLHIMTLRPESRTPGGLVVDTVSSSYHRAFLTHYLTGITSPAAAVLCADYFRSWYIQMLCGLYRRAEIVELFAPFATGLVQSLHFLRGHWPQLVRDIESGALTDQITDPLLRASVLDVLKPDPVLACFVAEQCSGSDWSGITAKLWPNVKCLRTSITGSMLQYRSVLESYAEGVPIVSMVYACSECSVGINLRPLTDPSEVTYTVLPNLAYFEFIPYGQPAEMEPEPVDLCNVELGKKYGLLVTTHAGLYRYQVGDVLEVTGFHNASPQFKFVCRDSVILSVGLDKTDEADLQRAVDRASVTLEAHGGTIISGYTSFAETKSSLGHYVIYWELMLREGAQRPGDRVMESCCLAMEEALNQVYREHRGNGAIGPLEIRVVRGGTFANMMGLAVARGATVDQYKAPRCVKDEEMIELLDSQVLSAHFSPACPNASDSPATGTLA